MRLRDFEKHLGNYGCFLLREGAKHSVYHNTDNGRTSTVPRHSELFHTLVKKICKDLDIPAPRGK